MQEFSEIVLDVWREVCRHIEIGEAAANIAQMLVRHMPIGEVLVRHIDPERGHVDTLATGLSGAEEWQAKARTECSAQQMTGLAAWCAGGQVIHRAAARGTVTRAADEAVRRAALPVVFPEGICEEVLAGPLKGHSGLVGALLLVARPGCLFAPVHREMMDILLEPFSVALENDHRLREMAALREAAEADKRSLLNRLGRKEIGDVIVGSDSGLRLVTERVELVSRSDVPVLILGETGTGKELIARAIHGRSGRAAGPIIRVNCGAIPPDLLDAQLFGHERGAFTGAVDTRQGWFERADGGTLFLDEIGELSLAAQVRLLRVLQDGTLERIGGHRTLHADVRVIAATHRDLAAMIAEGRFREDLWYRIAVFPIFLPPLRDRVADIPVLARHFAEKAAVRFGLPVLAPSDEDFRLLTAYAWPGNVRELASVMDRAAILGNGRQLEVAKSLGILDAGFGTPRPAPASVPRPNETAGLLTLDEAMRRHIESALAQTKGRIEGPFGAAVLLRINPHTLRARMRKLGLDWRTFRVR